MTTTRRLSPEIWVAEREAFIFQFQDRRFGDRASFCVPQATLKEMRPRYPFNPAAAFDALRSLIYSAALERVRLGSAMAQHVITAEELRGIEHIMPPLTANGIRLPTRTSGEA